MDKIYEVYINGKLARRYSTLREAEKALAMFPDATGQIFKIIPTVEIVLLREQMAVA